MKQQYNYEIVVDSQLGPRHGTLAIEENDNIISGILSLLGFENSVNGKREGKMLYLHHKLRTLVSQISCLSELELCENSIIGIIHSEFGNMKIRGKRTAKTENTQA